MRFSLLFENSGDQLPFELVANRPLFEYFVSQAESTNSNRFYINNEFLLSVEAQVDDVQQNMNTVKPVLGQFTSGEFDPPGLFENYLDQQFLNRTHCAWVKSQQVELDIDQLRLAGSELGERLHAEYPDAIRRVKLAQALDKLGYLSAYEEINMSIHRLENCFQDVVFDSSNKWELFDNLYKDSMLCNNSVTNFRFGFTYLGRQYYDKWQHFDDKLEFSDHYNYEKLEFSFNVGLEKPQTLPFSPEFLAWCEQHQIKPVGCEIPVANLIDLTENLFKYRKILYTNARDNNAAQIIID